MFHIFAKKPHKAPAPMTKEPKIALTLKEKCIDCVRFPNLVKSLVVMVCVVIVVEQVLACVQKLINKPISTYTHFEFNNTLLYPSVTLCRQPSYKYSKLVEFNLYTHPMYTSIWRDFDFSNHSLDDVWDQITFNERDAFVQYGLDGSVSNVVITANMGFVYGRCFTVSPAILSTRASLASGYSITLKHASEDVESNTDVMPPGYHVYIHYVREPFTEVEAVNGGLVEYLYVNMGEEVDVKLTVNQYVKISQAFDPCSDQEDYSANECTTKKVWQLVEDEAGCSGPWMKSELPRCNTYSGMRSLITAYMKYYDDHNFTSCPRICKTYMYNAFVTHRHENYLWDITSKTWMVRSGDATMQTQLYIHFNSMMVSVYEERHNYDWNLFISDLGGSVGFLLGLSVISLMAIVAKIWKIFLMPIISNRKDTASIATDVTTDIKHATDLKTAKYYMEKCNDWTRSNEKFGNIL